MQQKRRKILLVSLKAVGLAVLIPVVYWIAFKLLLDPVEVFVFEKIPTWLVFLIVIGVNIGWIVVMKVWPLKSIYIKIVLTLLVFTLSASFLTCLVALRALSGAFV